LIKYCPFYKKYILKLAGFFSNPEGQKGQSSMSKNVKATLFNTSNNAIDKKSQLPRSKVFTLKTYKPSSSRGYLQQCTVMVLLFFTKIIE